MSDVVAVGSGSVKWCGGVARSGCCCCAVNCGAANVIWCCFLEHWAYVNSELLLWGLVQCTVGVVWQALGSGAFRCSQLLTSSGAVVGGSGR